MRWRNSGCCSRQRDPVLDHPLAFVVRRVRLAGQDQLHRAQRIREQAAQPLGIVEQQVGALVGGEAAGKAEGQNVRVEHLLGGGNGDRPMAAHRELPAQPAARVGNQSLAAAATHRPQLVIGQRRDLIVEGGCGAAPALLAAGRRPQPVGIARVPARDVDAIGDMADRHLALWPAAKQRLEDVPADPAVLAADADAQPGATHRQIGHVERLSRVVRIGTAERQNLRQRDANLAQKAVEIARVGVDQRRREAIEPGFHRGMRREDVAGARRPPRLPERPPGAALKATSPLHHRKGRVALVQVADTGLRCHSFDDPPAGDAEHDLLQQPGLGVGIVETLGDGAVGRVIAGIVGVEQVERDPPDLGVPHAQRQLAPRQVEDDVQPGAVRPQRRPDRQRAGVVVGVGFALPAGGVDRLSEISLLKQQADADHRQAEIACGLEIVAGQHAEAAGIKRQRGAEAELHAEIGDAAQRCLAIGGSEPAGRAEISPARLRQAVKLGGKYRVGGQLAQLLVRQVLQDRPRVLDLLPGLGVDPLP